MALLLVDDSPDNRLLLSVLLEAGGHADVLLAESAQAAFELLGLEGEPPTDATDISLILMDIHMPEMDGIAACRRIKATPHLRDVPLIMVTAETEVEKLGEAFAAGAMDYITKPVREMELHARIHSALMLKAEMDRRKAREQELLDVMLRLESANRELHRLSSVDGLSGVANRRRFDEFLADEWRRAMRERQPVSLILADIDLFKQYNDTLGHLAGDDCLRQVASALQEALRRPSDLVARYGGEEFAVVLGNTDSRGARRVARVLRDQIVTLALPHPCSSVCEHVTLSLGIATLVPRYGSNPATLIAAADRALYQAKQRGRNRLHADPRDLTRLALI